MSFEEVKEVFVDTLNCDADKVTMDASLTDDLQADSLDAVALNMAFEDDCRRGSGDAQNRGRHLQLSGCADSLKGIAG